MGGMYVSEVELSEYGREDERRFDVLGHLFVFIQNKEIKAN